MKGDPDMSGSLLAAVTRSYLLFNGDADIDTIHRLLSGAIEVRDATPHDHDDACLQAVAILFFVCFLGGRAESWGSFHAALDRLGTIVPEEFYILSQLMSDPVRLGPAVLDRLDRAIAGLDAEDHVFVTPYARE